MQFTFQLEDVVETVHVLFGFHIQDFVFFEKNLQVKLCIFGWLLIGWGSLLGTTCCGEWTGTIFRFVFESVDLDSSQFLLSFDLWKKVRVKNRSVLEDRELLESGKVVLCECFVRLCDRFHCQNVFWFPLVGSWITHQDVVVVLAIVVIVKVHDPTHERMLKVCLHKLPTVCDILLVWYHNGFLEQLGCFDARVYMHRPKRFYFAYTSLFFNNILVRLWVWISGAAFCFVTQLSTAKTPPHFGLVFHENSTCFKVFIVILGDMLVEVTSVSVYTSLAAAPPHLTGPFRPVSATRPVKVFSFLELFMAVWTLFEDRIFTFTSS